MIIGIDIGGTNLRGILYAGGDKFINRIQIPSGADKGYSHTFVNVCKLIRILRDSEKKKISAIGVGCAGLIDNNKGIIHFSPNFRGWRNIHLKRDIEKIFPIPSFIINDVNSALWGEINMGAGKNAKNVVCVTLGTGLGGALYLDNKLHFGSHNLAGEIGHTILKKGGRKCTCGKRGCLEAYVSAASIIKTARKYIKKYPGSILKSYKSFTVRDVANAAKKNDRVSVETFREIAGYLGVGLANVSVLLDIDVILVGGNVSRTGAALFNPLRENFKKNIWKFTRKKVKIQKTSLGADSGLFGAALWAHGRSGESM